MKIGYVQTSPTFGDKEGNCSQIKALLQGISADLIVLPELFATGYTFVSKREAEALAPLIDQFLRIGDRTRATSLALSPIICARCLATCDSEVHSSPNPDWQSLGRLAPAQTAG